MAVKQTGIEVGGKKKEYQCATTDAVETYPTDCGPGSTMIIINETTHTVDSYKYFDGTNWNTI